MRVTCQPDGREDVAEVVRKLYTDFTPHDFLAAGDKVVVLGTSREGRKGSGRLVDFRWVHVFTFRNGKIVAFEEPADVSELAAEFRRSRT